jgi:hypothetical protein
MLRLLLLFSCFFISRFVAATSLVRDCPPDSTTAGGRKVALVRYTKWQGDSLVENGLIVRGQYVACKVEVAGSDYVLGFGNPHTRVPVLSFAGATVPPANPFNGRRNGQRVGIWFTCYPWGRLRRATMYQAGQVERVVYFRPNGKLRRVVQYSHNKPRRLGSYCYDRAGFVIGSTISL